MRWDEGECDYLVVECVCVNDRWWVGVLGCWCNDWWGVLVFCEWL